MDKEELFEGMKKISAYFKYNADSNALFTPEFEASDLINQKIDANKELTIQDLKEMISIITKTEEQDHYDGTGWMDYKMHFSAFMKMNGFEVSWGSKDKMTIITAANKSNKS